MDLKEARFWDKQAKSYALKPIKDTKSYNEMLETMSAHLKPNDKVLEIGCGTGNTAVKMADKVTQWVGSDISSEMINIAKSREAPASTKFIVADADTEFEDAPFDAVFTFHVLHLVPDITATLRNIHQQLKPEGLFISKTVCIGEMGFLPKIVLPIMKKLGVAPNVRELTKDELYDEIAAAGFKVKESRFFGTNTQSPYFVAKKLSS